MAAKPWLIIPLVLPVRDQEYTINPVDYTAGLELINVLTGDSDTIKADSPNETLFRLVMGTVWEDMLADRLPFNLMFRAGMAATTYQVALVNDQSAKTAVAAGEAVWESGVDPEAVAAAMAAPLKRPAPKRSPNTVSANGTPKRASTKVTTSPKATRPAKASGRAPASPGRR